MTTITTEQLSLILPTNKSSADWVSPLNDNLSAYGVDTAQRIASFLSQCAHESCDFTHLHENLNYGVAGLLATFPHHFTTDLANQYAHQPERIANRIYSNRMLNGDELSGDGYKYRGRGILQITGKANYHICSQSLYGDDRLIDTPELLESDLTAAVLSALWYWNTRLLNVPADAGDVLAITKKINGGTLGIDDRLSRYTNALNVLQRR
jgi:putative chitinase